MKDYDRKRNDWKINDNELVAEKKMKGKMTCYKFRECRLSTCWIDKNTMPTIMARLLEKNIGRRG